MFRERSSTLARRLLALALAPAALSNSSSHAFLVPPVGRPASHHRALSLAAAAGPGGGQGSPEPMRPLLAEGIDLRQVDAPAAGRLLVAKPWEFNHFTSKSCLFVFKHDPEVGSRAVVLERPTAFTLAELSPAAFGESIFANHTVFLGGEQGGDMAVLLHPYAQVPGARPVGGGLYYGGLGGAEAMLREQEQGLADHGLDIRRFKWWFNYMSWSPGQLERQVEGGSWDVMEGDAGAVLRQGPALERDLWAVLRRHYLPRIKGYGDEEEEG